MSSRTPATDRYKLMHVVTVPGTLGFFDGQFDYFRLHGYDISVVASPTANFEQMVQELSVKGHRIPMEREISPLKDLAALVRFWSLFRRERPDIVHGHTPKGGFLSMLAAWLARVPLRVYHLHGLRFETTQGLKRRILMFVEQLSCLFAHRVIAVSHSVAEKAVEHRLCRSNKIKVLGEGSVNGVDAQGRFSPDAIESGVRSRLRHKYGIPDDAVVVGFVGRLTKDKGIVELVDAWRIVSAQMPNVHLLIVGEFESGDPVPVEVRESLQAGDRIHLTGRVTNMPEVYRTMDLVVLPTYREGLPQVLLEAAAMELPVVATFATGCVDAVEDGRTGLLVPVGDANALATSIMKYVADAGLRAEHGRAGRRRVLQCYRPEDVWLELDAEYKVLMREHSPRRGSWIRRKK